ncbi:MAG: hypothetical protein NZ805_02755 [Armatimonadetes bacterium]|nr:hypothetical protein [Armatimonadota bacterium]MDW8028784.1 hypothetical protein [Armatimonadota bacterium]
MTTISQLLKMLLERTERGELVWEKLSRVDYETEVSGQSGVFRFTLSLVPTIRRPPTGRIRFTPEQYLPHLLAFRVEALVPILYIVDVQQDREIAKISGDDPNLERENFELLERLYDLVEKQARSPEFEQDLQRALQALAEAKR